MSQRTIRPYSTTTNGAVTVAGSAVLVSMLATSGSNGVNQTGQLVALDTASGQVLWRYATPTPNSLGAGDGLVILPEGNPYFPASIVALRMSDGTVAWRHSGFPPQPAGRGNILYRAAAVGGGLVLVGGGGNTLWALHADDGSLAWKTSADYHSYSTVAIENGTVFVNSRFTGTGSPFPMSFIDSRSHIFALRVADGTPYWQATEDDISGVVIGSA
jgi:outer membrane protein assembly factor BamB